MQARLRHLWEIIKTGYWFVPTLMMIAAIVLAFVLLFIDRRDVVPEAHLTWLYTGGADGAKTVLSTIAGSTITVAGVAFSITIAALSQASSQFGPRLLRNFMRDTGNQIVLGTFVATFIYCLLVLRSIRGEFEGGKAFVPHASVTAAVLMAAASIAMLIYFIHHISISLQAPSVVAAVAADLRGAIADFPERQGRPPHERPGSNSEGNGPPRPVASTCSGYLQMVDQDELVRLAQRHNLVISLAYRPGDYIILGSQLATLTPSGPSSDEIDKAINAAFVCGIRPTPEQDVEFAFRQLVEVAVRALSPGINDPFTAINCVDALGSALCDVAKRDLPEPQLADDKGQLRVIRPVTTFEGLADASFNQLRQYGHTSVATMIRLLDVLTECVRQIPEASRQLVLTRHVEMIVSAATQVITIQEDLTALQDRRQRFLKAMAAGQHPPKSADEGARPVS